MAGVLYHDPQYAPAGGNLPAPAVLPTPAEEGPCPTCPECKGKGCTFCPAAHQKAALGQ